MDDVATWNASQSFQSDEEEAFDVLRLFVINGYKKSEYNNHFWRQSLLKRKEKKTWLKIQKDRGGFKSPVRHRRLLKWPSHRDASMAKIPRLTSQKSGI